MQKHAGIGNATEFTKTTLKCISGAIPKDIAGNYFRNGPGLLNYGAQHLTHWFEGDGCILKVGFKDGECSAQMSFVDTPAHRRRTASQSLSEGMIGKMWRRWREGKQSGNIANTSVLMLKNSPDFLAICEAGDPYILKKQDLKSVGFSNYGWITSAFSAHPKVDPENGDIFNIGMSLPNMTIMRATKDMKKICQTQFRLREIQSIHDFCMAGDYVLLFEAPLRFHLKDMLWGNKMLYDCLTFDETLPTLVHIFTKQNLQHVKTIDFEPFYSFHFTNGFSTKQKIVVQYVRYDIPSAKSLFKLISDIPKYTQPDFKVQHFGGSTLEQLTIDLTDFKTTSKSVKLNGEFPVCEDHQAGKQWRYTYAVGSSSDELFRLNTINKFDRKQQKLSKMTIEGNAYVNETAIIRTKDNLYLLSIVNKDDKSFVNLYDADTLKNVCECALPVFVPAGFHGKWDSEKLNE